MQVLVLNEAADSVDAETDQLIQQTVRETFAHRRAVTIAHRLNTVVRCDVVIVLDTGKVPSLTCCGPSKIDILAIFCIPWQKLV